jgi:hypothetical protein
VVVWVRRRLTMNAELSKALAEAHCPEINDPETNKGDHVYQLWSDGEITQQKGGTLFNQRGIFSVAPALFPKPVFGSNRFNCRIEFPTYDEWRVKQREYERKALEAGDALGKAHDEAGRDWSEEDREKINKLATERERLIKQMERFYGAPTYIFVKDRATAEKLRLLMLDEYVKFVHAMAKIGV